ncbi:hypothetical protein WUBG_19282 [Wuchereria bancrofti]|uniref:IFT140 second beta-propeller domain-containing protein n=1 Tax=Wuchereria bancrofti TaxID=6293 RepID=J9A7C0_WUCBA|nr:hypothetical protein WUBG_19282 [Wuchereria bancrofti]
MIDINNNWICIASNNGFIRIYDLSAREARQQYHSKDISKMVQDFKYFCILNLTKWVIVLASHIASMITKMYELN